MTNFDFKKCAIDDCFYYCKKLMGAWESGDIIISKIQVSYENHEVTLLDSQGNKYFVASKDPDTKLFDTQEELNQFLEKLISGEEKFKFESKPVQRISVGTTE